MASGVRPRPFGPARIDLGPHGYHTKVLQHDVERVAAASVLLVTFSLGACSVDRQTGKSTATGAATGAAAGAVVGMFGGNFLSSVGVGAAAGAASGFVYDQIKKSE